jgi:hypothetical protein
MTDYGDSEDARVCAVTRGGAHATLFIPFNAATLYASASVG